ncbi:MAG: hypothetical protein ACKPKO_38325, partial [Candidatus Fonsibacter sp.]
MTNFLVCGVIGHWALYTAHTQRTQYVGTVGAPGKGPKIGQAPSVVLPGGKGCIIGADVMHTVLPWTTWPTKRRANLASASNNIG